MKYTDGPWVAQVSGDGSGDIGILSHGNITAKAGCIAEVFSDIHKEGERSQETHFNAALIAAAPEMYEALKAILRGHEAPSGASIGEAALCPMFEALARAALKKAEGL